MSPPRISAYAERPWARQFAVLRRRSSVFLGVAAAVLVTLFVLTVIDRRGSDRGVSGLGGSDGGLVAQPQLIANTWRALPIAPIVERKSYAATWAVSEMLVWGGIANDQSHAPLDDGAAYSPATNSWRVLPKSPLGPRSGSLSVWSGSEWFVLGGGDRGNRLVDGAAFNPVTNRWRKIADLPFRVAVSGRAAWTGVGIVLWDGQTAVYEPSANRWHIGANSPEPPALFGDAVQIGIEFVTVGKSGLSFTLQAYNWMTNSWRTISSPPWDGPFGNAVVANAGNELFIGGGGTGGNEQRSAYVYNFGTSRWRQLPDAPVGFSGNLDYADATVGRFVAGFTSEGSIVMFDVLAQQWSVGAPDPVPQRRDSPTISTGVELVVWAGSQLRQVIPGGFDFIPAIGGTAYAPMT